TALVHEEPMDDETAFLHAILSEPADAARPLVFADWLEEQGRWPEGPDERGGCGHDLPPRPPSLDPPPPRGPFPVPPCPDLRPPPARGAVPGAPVPGLRRAASCGADHRGRLRPAAGGAPVGTGRGPPTVDRGRAGRDDHRAPRAG